MKKTTGCVVQTSLQIPNQLSIHVNERQADCLLDLDAKEEGVGKKHELLFLTSPSGMCTLREGRL